MCFSYKQARVGYCVRESGVKHDVSPGTPGVPNKGILNPITYRGASCTALVNVPTLCSTDW